MPIDIQETSVDTLAQWDRMISAVAAAGPVKAAAVLASIVATAPLGEGGTGTDVDVATNAKHTQITLIILTLTGISLRTSGNALGLCAHMSCSWRPCWPQKKRPELPRDELESKTNANDSVNTTNVPADQ